MPKDQGDIYVATETFSADVNGSPQIFQKGMTRVRAGHPVLKGREGLFALVENSVDYEWEQATAAPGEKRGAADAPREKITERTTEKTVEKRG